MALSTSQSEGEGGGKGRSKPSIVILTFICVLKVWFPCYWPRLSLRKLFIHNDTEGDREMTKGCLANRNVSVYALRPSQVQDGCLGVCLPLLLEDRSFLRSLNTGSQLLF